MKRYLVERELIQNNIQVLQKKAGSAVIWAVLKGNGYGLGLLPMAETCRAAGLDHFAVTEIAEARALREGGFETEPILMLQPTADADEITALLPLHVIFTISSTEDASVLAGLAAQAGVTAEAHIKIDTGMGRYGFLPEEMEKITPVYHYMDTIHVTGIYTHLHSAFCDKKATKAQIESFGRVLAALREATDDSMTRDEMLRAMYLYVRDSFTYLRRHYYKTGDVGWATQEALTMYSTGRGNCYCFASAFWAAARALGFDAKIVSGTYGEEEAPHGWVEILRGGERYTYDVEIEMAVRRDRGASDLYEMDDSARRRHGYQEFSATDDMLPRSLAGELLPG